jgi:hypothetical protein
MLGYDAAVGEKNAAAALRQVVSVFGHYKISVIGKCADGRSRAARFGLVEQVPHSVAVS